MSNRDESQKEKKRGWRDRLHIHSSRNKTASKSETFLGDYPNVVHFLKGTLVNGLVIAADASNIPGVKAAATAIQALVKFAENVKEHREQVKELAKEAAGYLDGLLQIPKPTGSVNTDIDVMFKQLVDKLMDELERTTATMEEIVDGNTSRFAELWKQGDMDDKIKARAGALQKARQKFMTLAAALNHANSQRILQTSSEILQILHKSEWDTSHLPYITAAYDQDETVRICHDQTRVAILNDLYARLLSMSEHDVRIIWLRALAGSGKSTIAKTVAAYLRREGILAGSFFFSRNISDRSGMAHVFATLANQLAFRNKEFAAQLLKAITADPELKYAQPTKQLEELLIKPLSALSSPPPFVFVVDALDECGKDQGNAFLKLLLPYIPRFPSSFRFFLTSRPEAPIINQLSSSDDLPIHTINIDEKSHEATSHQDIHVYCWVELCKVKGLNVKKHEVSALVKLANGLFQFAVTAVRLITESLRNPRMTLNSILKIGHSGSVVGPQHVTLNSLYTTVFKHAYSSDNNDYTESPEDIARLHHLVIGAVVHVRVPVSMTTLTALVGLKIDDVEWALKRLSSVLLLPDSKDPDAPVRIRHLTFTEYVTNPKGDLFKLNSELVIDNRTHGIIAERSLLIATKQLRFNISEFKSSFVPNSAESLAHAKKAIPRDLAYACQFWGYHLEHMLQDTVLDLLQVAAFMEKKLLFWFEALGALGVVNVARAALVSLDRWLELDDKKKNVPPLNIKSLVKDAIKFIAYFAPAIAQSPPHTYLSALPFSPTCSQVARLYLPLFNNIPLLEIGQLPNWPPRELVSRGHSGTVTSVAFSPDGHRVVSGSDDRTIRIWDAETGQPVGEPFKGHSNWVTSVAFSPDGHRVVSGSRDDTIRIWDAETSQPVGESFKGHSDTITSVAFLPNGHIVSGSADKTIQIHDPTNSISSSSFGTQAVLHSDGWVQGPEGQLLLWVPPLHRLSFHWPHTVRVMGPHETRANCRNVKWGEEWTRIMKS